MTRVKIAELTSTTGALILGLGLGALLSKPIGRAAVPVLVFGLLLHAVGMWTKHRIETREANLPAWVVALYWTCWIALALVVLGLPFFR